MEISFFHCDSIVADHDLEQVMTTVYGVTFIGARDQIHKQLRDRGDIDKEELWATSSYLARQVCFLQPPFVYL